MLPFFKNSFCALQRFYSIKKASEVSCAAGVAKLAQRLCLYLSYSLSGYIKFFSDFLKRSRASVVKTEAKLYNVLLSGSKRMQFFLYDLAQYRSCGGIGRSGSIFIGNKISEMAVFFLADRSFKRYGVLRYLHYLPYLFGAHSHVSCDLVGSRLVTKLLKKLSLDTGNLMNRFNHVNGNSYRSCLICYRSRYCLSDPPGCVS